MPLGMGLASRVMGRLTAKVGPRWPLTIGASVVAIGFALLVLVDDGALVGGASLTAEKFVPIIEAAARL
jgi:triosephosphate isomerase